MHCSRVKNLLSAYSDRELGGDEMLAIQRHLGDCPECRQEHEGYQQVKQLFRGLPDIAPHSGFDPSVLDRPRASRHPSALAMRLEMLWGEAQDRLDILRRWSRRMFPTFHTESQLVALTCVSIGVVAALAMQRPQPADAVRAHVPENLAADYDDAAPGGARLVGYSSDNGDMRPLGFLGPDGRLYLFRSSPSDPVAGLRNEPHWMPRGSGASLASHRR